MFINTQDNLDNNSNSWNSIPIIVTAKNDLDEIVARIRQKSGNIEIDTASVVQRKNKILNILAIKVSSLSGTLQAYANQKDDMDLLKHIKVRKSDIINLPENDVSAKVKSVIKEARKWLEPLNVHGVTEEMLVEMETSLEDLGSLIGKPRSIRNNKFVNLKSVEDLFREGKKLLTTQLDNLMLRYRETDLPFYNSYQRSRTIVYLK